VPSVASEFSVSIAARAEATQSRAHNHAKEHLSSPFEDMLRDPEPTPPVSPHPEVERPVGEDAAAARSGHDSVSDQRPPDGTGFSPHARLEIHATPSESTRGPAKSEGGDGAAEEGNPPDTQAETVPDGSGEPASDPSVDVVAGPSAPAMLDAAPTGAPATTPAEVGARNGAPAGADTSAGVPAMTSAEVGARNGAAAVADLVAGGAGAVQPETGAILAPPAAARITDLPVEIDSGQAAHKTPSEIPGPNAPQGPVAKLSDAVVATAPADLSALLQGFAAESPRAAGSETDKASAPAVTDPGAAKPADGPHGPDLASTIAKPPLAPPSYAGNASPTLQPSVEATVQLSGLAAAPPPGAPPTPAPDGSQIPRPAPIAVPFGNLAIEISARARAGGHRFDIRLDPPELGRIEVRLHVGRQGDVTSHLVVDRPETLDLLRRDASDLERSLQQAGLKTADNGLQFSLRDQSSGADADARDRRAARVLIPEIEAAGAAQPANYIRAGHRSGLDIRV
jgi:hypothetical protein